LKKAGAVRAWTVLGALALVVLLGGVGVLHADDGDEDGGDEGEDEDGDDGLGIADGSHGSPGTIVR
jgi:hypothetical protein